MSGDDVQRLRESYEALNRGDLEACVAVLDQDAIWNESAGLPSNEEIRGRDAIERFLRGFLDTWGDFRQDVVETVEAGDRVAVVIRSVAVGAASGVEVEARYAHVWTLRDGLGVRVDAYRDVDAALRALEAESRTP